MSESRIRTSEKPAYVTDEDMPESERTGGESENSMSVMDEINEQKKAQRKQEKRKEQSDEISPSDEVDEKNKKDKPDGIEIEGGYIVPDKTGLLVFSNTDDNKEKVEIMLSWETIQTAKEISANK